MHFKEFYRGHKKLFKNFRTTLFILAIQIQNVWIHIVHLKIWSAYHNIHPKASNNQDFVIKVFYAWIPTVLLVLTWFTHKTLIQFSVIDYLIGSGHYCQYKPTPSNRRVLLAEQFKNKHPVAFCFGKCIPWWRTKTAITQQVLCSSSPLFLQWL